jgi:hypothetical protein
MSLSLERARTLSLHANNLKSELDREKSRLVFEVGMMEKQLYRLGRANGNFCLKINKKSHVFTVTITLVHIMRERINTLRVS